MDITLRLVPREERLAFATPVLTAFGMPVNEERIARTTAIPEIDVELAAYDGAAVVGAAGAFRFGMTVPGGASVDTQGLTMVAVRTTHRRRGILTSLIRRCFDIAREKGQFLAALWASEGGIYGRFGYGVASFAVDVDVPRHKAALLPPRGGEPNLRFRFVEEDEATALFPPIWDRVRAVTPGMLTRSEAWWRIRRLGDPPAMRGNRTTLLRVVGESGGVPAAYALYRLAQPLEHGMDEVPLDVVEAIGDSPASTRAVWRYLLDIDIIGNIRAPRLASDHPLLHMALEPRRLRAVIKDALWVRLLDVEAALNARAYGEVTRPLTIAVEDAFCPWNQGAYRIDGEAAKRTSGPADLALDAATLGAIYMGGMSATSLALAGRIDELTPGSLAVADRMFSTGRAAWCPEIF